ncbi:MAG: cytochrome c oxidase subunit II [Candidatus Promineifilaceae bacterium]
MKNQGRHLATVIALVLIATVAVYYAVVAMFPIMTVASLEGEMAQPLFTAHYLVISFLFSLIVVFILYSVVAFRQKEGEDLDGYYTHGNTALEVAWTFIPVVVVIVFAVWGSNMLIDMTNEENDPNAWVVNVTGRKWAWQFEYPEADKTIGQFVVPVGRPVLLNLESEDIIHSFWVPEFHVKQDLLPGTNKQLRFTATMTNEQIADDMGQADYQPLVRCAEICGTSHAYMLANVFSVPDTDAAKQKIDDLSKLPSDPVDRGAFYYDSLGCISCHSLDGTLDGYAGPTWQGIYGREEELATGEVIIVDDLYIETSIYDPNGQIVAGYAPAVMPQNFEQQFADLTASYVAEGFTDVDMIAELIAFMQTLDE